MLGEQTPCQFTWTLRLLQQICYLYFYEFRQNFIRYRHGKFQQLAIVILVEFAASSHNTVYLVHLIRYRKCYYYY